MPLPLAFLMASLLDPGCPGERPRPTDPIDRPVRVVRTYTPRLPPALRGIGFDGKVALQFIVCRDGSVDSASIRVVRSDDPRLDALARSAIRNVRFAPAMWRGRAVAQLVQQGFRFTDHTRART